MYNRAEDDNFGDVGRFHTKFGLPSVNDDGPGPTEIDPELLLFRVNFLLEELQELMDAAGLVWSEHGEARILFADPGDEVDIDHAQFFDALLDLVYVAHGTAHLLGYPWQKGWQLVQMANMAKVRAQSDGSDSKRGSSFDVVKPEGWTAPNIKALLDLYGYDTLYKENDE